jgi:hypothetical protein
LIDLPQLRIAVFVSPHGFGHAARSSAVMAEIHRQSGASFDIFTSAPRWFFEESISGLFRYHEHVVDVGFRQRSALTVDLAETVAALRDLVPFDDDVVGALADQVRSAGCRAVLCDVAPLGIAVAEAAGLPSVLVENFAWGWLYAPLAEEAPGLAECGALLDGWAERATVHIQAEPMCDRRTEFESVVPISRLPRMGRQEARAALDVEGAVVVVTMGGYGEPLPFLDRLRVLSDVTFIVTGADATGIDGNLRLYDNNTPLFMPDVMRAADAVVAKLGYGTVAEVWREGLPFAHVTRPNSREMASLEAFVAREMSGFLLERDTFTSGAWIDRLPDLLALPRRPHEAGGAERVAESLLEVARTGLVDRKGKGSADYGAPMSGSVTPSAWTAISPSIPTTSK